MFRMRFARVAGLPAISVHRGRLVRGVSGESRLPCTSIFMERGLWSGLRIRHRSDDRRGMGLMVGG